MLEHLPTWLGRALGDFRAGGEKLAIARLGIPASEQGLVEGALDGDTAPGFLLGRNSYRKSAWLPADPPSGHGRHRYVFQLFALDAMPVVEESPGRDAFLDAIRGSIVGAAMLVGVYQRP